jgi:hypothetical protein
MTHEQLVHLLLHPLFRCIPAEYKVSYSRTIWEQFESRIRASAYTDRLPVFLENIKRKLGIRLRKEYVAGVAQVVNESDDRAVLAMLRDDTTYLTILTRLRNDAEKEQIKEP